MNIEDAKSALKNYKRPYCNQPRCIDCQNKNKEKKQEPRDLKQIIENELDNRLLELRYGARRCQTDVAGQVKDLMYEIHALIRSKQIFAENKKISWTWLHDDIHLFLAKLYLQGNIDTFNDVT